MYMVKGYTEPRVFDSDGNLTTSEGIIIYNDIYATEGAKATSPKLTLKDNSAGSLEIVLPPGNAGYDKLERLTSEIVVFRDKTEIWSGRIITESKDFWNNRTLTCEGELAYLNDTIQPQKEYADTTVEEFLAALIDVHNSKVDASKQFMIGAVDVYAKDDDGNDDTITRVTDNENTLTAISEQLVDYFEGHLKIRKENGVRYLDYRQDWTSTNTQEIRFGQNLLDFTRDWDATNFATVVIPRGAQLDSSDIDGVTAYLDISDITSKTCPRCEGELTAAIDDDGNKIWQCQNDDCFYYKWYGEYFSTPRYSEFNICPSCGAEMEYDEDNDIFVCPDCGYETSKKMYVINDSQACPDCGAEMELNDDSDTFICPDCGYETEYTPFVIEEGQNYVANWNATQQFGWIEVVADWSDVTDADELLSEAQEYLSDLQFEDLTIEVTAIDLRYLGITTDSVGLLDEIRCVSFAHGLDKKFPVSEMTIQLDQPENSTYILSDTEQTTLTSTVRTATTSVDSETHSITALQAAKNNAAYLINSATRGHVTIGRTSKGTEFIAIADDTSYNADGYAYSNSDADYGSNDAYNTTNDGLNYWDTITDSDNYYWSEYTKLWFWNMGGLGYSTDGGRTYVTAITCDGSIVADRITTGKLTTITIEAANGNSYWNLDNGEFVIKKGTISLGAFKNCPSCGAEMELNDNSDTFICPDCGYEVSIDEASYHFSVDDTGTIYAELGKIGGFKITSHSIYNDVMYLTDGDDDYGLEKGLWWTYVTSDDSRYAVGSFTITDWNTDSSVLGINMNLSYSTKARFISWGYQKSDGGDYEVKLMYTTKDFDDYEGDRLHFGCDVDGHGQKLYNMWIDPDTCKVDGGLGSASVLLPTKVSWNSSLNAYVIDEYLTNTKVRYGYIVTS